MERRRTRESFTRTIGKIVKKLAVQQSYEVTWKRAFLNNDDVISKLHVESLWVVGSYARGAETCGDLDLIMNIVLSKNDSMPFDKAISRTVIGRFPDVRLYIGTPEKNSSGVAFSEAKLIWSIDNSNWEDNLRNIPVDPNATRYQRKYDELPLRREQLYEGDIEHLEKIVGLKLQGLISWEWIPASELTVNPENWSIDAKDMFKRASWRTGKKTVEVMKLAIEWLQQYDIGGAWERGYRSNCQFKACGAEVFLGRPPLQIDLLDTLSCSRLVIVPHTSRRGPNGLWVISRGGKHPITRALKKCKAYYEAVDNKPWLCLENIGYKHITILDLFITKDGAENHLRGFLEDETDEELKVNIKHSKGNDLAFILSNVDLVNIYDSDDGFNSFPITDYGKRSEIFEFTDDDASYSIGTISLLLTY